MLSRFKTQRKKKFPAKKEPKYIKIDERSEWIVNQQIFGDYDVNFNLAFSGFNGYIKT